MSLKSYEHVCSTCQGLASLGKIEGVVPLVHGPQPCVYQNQVGSMFCRPAQLVTAGTLVSKSEVIFGGEESLKAQIKNIYNKYHPKLIVVFNTCVPQLIGEDVEGVIFELNEEIPDLKVTTFKTGFNYQQALPLGSDASWVAVIEGIDPAPKTPGSIGIVGRTGQDAGNMAGVELPLKRAGIKTYSFPAGHLDDMAKIARAETVYPLHITPFLTCKKLKEKFDQECTFIEVPAGISGTSAFLRAVADRQKCQALHDVVDQEEKRVLPELEKIKESFAKDPVRMLLVTGPANEVSIGKIYAEFGAEVFVIPCMRNTFYKQEKAIMEERFGVTFIEEDFDTLEDVMDEVKPNVVSCEFQGQVETMSRMMPTFINMLYLCEYGYDYALDLGANYFKLLKKPVYKHWQDLLERYGV